MKNKILKLITVPFVFLFFSSSSIAADLNIAFFASSSENGYNQATWEGVKKAAAEAGNVNAEIFNGEFNATLQYGQIEDIIASGKFDGFVVVPNDTVGIAGAIEQAIEAGIKVASSLFPIGPDLTTLEPQVAGLTATAAGSPVYGATLQANEVVKYCADKNPCNTIIMIGQKIYPFDKLRYDTFLEILGKESNINIVATVEGNYSPDVSLTGMTDALQSAKDVHVVLSNADQHLLGAEIALADAGYNVEDLYLMGGGAAEVAIEAIKAGQWDATFIGVPLSEGYRAAKAVIAALNGEDVDPIIDITKPEIVGIDPIITKEVLDANPGWQPEWGG